MRKILVIEDDSSLRYGISLALKTNGFLVSEASNVDEALKVFKQETFHLLLIDIMLPDGNGFELFEKTKEIARVPAIFLSALDDELNIITGLNIGADDYIRKPFFVGELISRVNAVLRRSDQTKEIIHHSDEITLNEDSLKVYKNNTELILSSTEFKMVKALMLNSQKVLTRERLLELVWDVDSNFVDDNTLNVNISRLRDKIETDPTNPKYIKTVRGVGYVWNIRST